MPQKKPILINKWYGWMSEANTLTTPWQFVYTSNVDGKSEPEFLQLNLRAQPLVNTWSWIPTSFIEDYGTFGDWFVFCDNWTIYSTTSWNLVYTMTGNKPIYNAISFGATNAPWWNKYLWFYEDGWMIKMASIDRANADVISWAWDVTENYWVFTPALPFHTLPAQGIFWEPYCLAVNNSEDFLYFSTANQVYMGIFSQLPFFEKMLEFEDQIVWLTTNWPSINIYLRNGKKYIWDWFSETYDTDCDLWTNILYAYNNKNYDYIVAGNAGETQLYTSQWQSFQLLKSTRFTRTLPFPLTKFNYDLTSSRFWNFSMATDKSNLFLFNWWEWEIEAMGNLINWLPKWSNHITNVSGNWFWIDNIWLFFCPRWRPNTLYFWHLDTNWNYWLSEIHTDRTRASTNWVFGYTDSGYVITQKFDFWIPMENRAIEYQFRHDIFSNTSITIDYSIDWWPFQNLVVISDINNPDLPKKSRVLQSTAGVPFYEISYRITLQSSDLTKSPRLYSMFATYEQKDN